MICPSCKCEYIRGVTQCADCGVPLVDTLDSLEATLADDVPIVAIWKGKDPGEFERIQEALENAGVPFTVQDAKSSFQLVSTEPTMEIWVPEGDRERARNVVLDLEGRINPDELTPEEIESLALPESDQSDSEDEASEPENLPENWYEDEPVSEVWSGDKEEVADTLVVCLREIGIGSHKFSEAGHCRLVVRPEKGSRAKEIVREVVEASPPE
jgi:Putative prokaryotic signal transducing protein